MGKNLGYIYKNPDLLSVLILGIIFYLTFFYNIGNYPLMDVDESRYVSMAKDMFQSKDFFTLYLNNEYFFEKPPLYFWLECFSFKLFRTVNEFSARFPVALIGTSCCYLVYFIGKKIISRKYGIISSLILATSLEFVILSKFAILDIVLSAFICYSLIFGLIAYFCRESRKKYYWWLFYLCSGLAVMAKGIPGFVIPFGSMFLIACITNRIKEIFKPIYIIPGMLLFLLITLPWHILMFIKYNPLFWEEYIIKHHLARFLGSRIINREQPFYFFFITLIWGFFPWIFSCCAVWIKQISSFIKEYRNKNFKFNYKKLSITRRFILHNIIVSVFTLFFFSSSGTKLITYILPIYPFLAFLGGYVWLKYIERGEYSKLINNTNYFVSALLFTASFAGILTPLYLSPELLSDISSTRIFSITTTFAISLSILLFTKRKIYTGVFISYLTFIILFSAFATKDFFEIDYKFGQNDLMKFAQYAKEHNVTLTTFNFGHKYSLIYYGEKPVVFGTKLKPNDLEETLNKEKNMVIIKLKDIKYLIDKDFDIIDIGRKYALIEERNKGR